MYDAASGGFILITPETYKGYAFLDEGVLLPRFADVKPLKGGKYVMVKTLEGKWGYVDSKLQEFFED